MIQKGLQIINILALILSGLAFSWVYTEHTDLTPTQNQQLYQKKTEEINKVINNESLKKSYIEYVNTSRNEIKIHNYKAEKIINLLLSLLVILGINFVLLIILNEKQKKLASN